MKFPFTNRHITFRKKHFLLAFATITLILWGVKLANPSIALPRIFGPQTERKQYASTDTVGKHSLTVDNLIRTPRPALYLTDSAGNPLRHRVMSVSSFDEAFPDLNDVQLATASHLGIPSAADRQEASKRKKDLVFIGENPYYHVNRLDHSIPYLIPRAAILLEEVGRAFLDSLAVKDFPLHQIVVTSVLRTRNDVARLRRHNVNASTQSCHQHGTTFDISYNKFIRVQQPDTVQQPISDGVLLKAVLAEVLNDLRQRGLCYVKYEKKQSCFHVTAR